MDGKHHFYLYYKSMNVSWQFRTDRAEDVCRAQYSREKDVGDYYSGGLPVNKMDALYTIEQKHQQHVYVITGTTKIHTIFCLTYDKQISEFLISNVIIKK